MVLTHVWLSSSFVEDWWCSRFSCFIFFNSSVNHWEWQDPQKEEVTLAQSDSRPQALPYSKQQTRLQTDHAADQQKEYLLPLKPIQIHQSPGKDQPNGFTSLQWMEALENPMEIKHDLIMRMETPKSPPISDHLVTTLIGIPDSECHHCPILDSRWQP